MFEAWWLEFKDKDCKAGSFPSKLCFLFRGDGVKLSPQPYESGNGKLLFDPHDAPVLSYQWLPTPPRRLDIDERDFVVFERNTRATLRALNFIESVLQTWMARDDQDFLLTQFCMSITRAVKCAM